MCVAAQTPTEMPRKHASAATPQTTARRVRRAAIRANSAATARAVCGRFAESFARSCTTSAEMSRGTARSTACGGGGVWEVTAAMAAPAVGPANATFPVSIW